MNERINLQDFITSLLVDKNGLSIDKANRFIREFFSLVEQGLERDRYVKIKGLGTFKLVGVESRESVNVNTGERFTLPAYTKISFTPDAALRDIINKPFAHFETVVLNENVVIDDITADEKDFPSDDRTDKDEEKETVYDNTLAETSDTSDEAINKPVEAIETFSETPTEIPIKTPIPIETPAETITNLAVIQDSVEPVEESLPIVKTTAIADEQGVVDHKVLNNSAQELEEPTVEEPASFVPSAVVSSTANIYVSYDLSEEELDEEISSERSEYRVSTSKGQVPHPEVETHVDEKEYPFSDNSAFSTPHDSIYPPETPSQVVNNEPVSTNSASFIPEPLIKPTNPEPVQSVPTQEHRSRAEIIISNEIERTDSLVSPISPNVPEPIKPRSKAILSHNDAEAGTKRKKKKRKKEKEVSPVPYLITFLVVVLLLCGGAIIYIYFPGLFGAKKPVSQEMPMPNAADSVEKTKLLADSLLENSDSSGISSATDAETEKAQIRAEMAQKAIKNKTSGAQFIAQQGIKKGESKSAENVSSSTVGDHPALIKKKSEAVAKGSGQPARSNGALTTTTKNKPAASPNTVKSYADNVHYKIVGIKGYYKLKKGESLTRISQKYYGTKGLWTYIVQYNSNKIKDSNNVPYGITIKIPELRAK